MSRELLARAWKAGAGPGDLHFILPGQWEGLPKADGRPHKEAVAVQVPVGEVERRSLEVYELAALEVCDDDDCPGTGTPAPGDLGLKQAVEVLDNTLDASANQQLTYADVLAQFAGR